MFGETLGQGAFGVVVKAEALGLTHKTEKQFVAVKMLKGIHCKVITLFKKYVIEFYTHLFQDFQPMLHCTPNSDVSLKIAYDFTLFVSAIMFIHSPTLC